MALTNATSNTIAIRLKLLFFEFFSDTVPLYFDTMNIAEWIERVTRQLDDAPLFFGHGTDNARDEAAWLVLHAVGAPLDGSFSNWGKEVDSGAETEIERLTSARRKSRQPLAYLLGTAWFAGLEFSVNPDVLVPRSPIAELILDGYRPWVNPDRVNRMLDMCTGSGCIAIASALQLPRAHVDAVDVSAKALDVAAQNVKRHGLGERVTLLQSDLFRSIDSQKYDLIVANPPYVPLGSLAELPAEYRAEPGLGLVSGLDGLEAVLSILVDAPAFLGEDGILICEVGESNEALVAALPGVPFLWLEFEQGGSGVFVLNREQLQAAGSELTDIVGVRRNVI
jgi:ribosomal protein L3 glutamine methyltransferase